MASLVRRLAPAAALGGLAVVIVGVADPAIANLTRHDASTGAVTDPAPQALAATGGQGGQQRSEPQWRDLPQEDKPSAQQDTSPQQDAPQQDQPATACATGEQVDGDPVMTPWGPVQVAASVDNGTVCFVQAVDWPRNDRKSQMINSYAIPELDSMASQVGTQFDHISGATYTSEAYRDSLQSLLDRL